MDEWHHGDGELADHVEPAPGESDSGDSARQRQQEALRREGSDELSAARAQGKAYRQFLLADDAGRGTGWPG